MASKDRDCWMLTISKFTFDWSLHSFLTVRRLARQNDMIAGAHRTVMETEDVANDITSELARNREKIESSRSKVS